ncbi:MAG TPA: aromatic amino acid lyase, partial [Rubrobacteraceae bacterium]|nr:aromatic amino acid lyase [Rubrobacteraceae bacterium]
MPRTGFRLELDGRSLKIEDVVAFARGRGDAECILSAESMEKIEASCALKQDLISRGIPIYGVTTGFGDSANRQISP